MGASTNIEWTDATWNPIRGCSRVSDGCRNCYAEKVAYRFSGEGQPYEGLVRFREVLRPGDGPARYDRVRKPEWNGQVQFAEKHLRGPLKWRSVKLPCAICGSSTKDACLHNPGPTMRSRRIFVNSMSDLFHENVPDEWIDKIFAVMALCPQHTFQILTKRPERMLKYLGEPGRRSSILLALDRVCWDLETRKGLPAPPKNVVVMGPHNDEYRFRLLENMWPLRNVWLGVSVENQPTADERIPLLSQIPAAVRFISAEPLLAPVHLTAFLGINHEDEFGERGFKIENPDQTIAREMNRLGGLPMHDPWVKGVDWVICGGESGPDARPMHPDWARSLRDQCQAAGVRFFFKQWGEWGPYRKDQNQYGSPALVQTEAGYKKHCTHVEKGDGTSGYVQRVGKKAAGALLDGREWREFPSAEVRA